MAVSQGTPYSGVAANPAYSGAPAGGVFIPEIWSGKLIEKFYAATVLSAIANTDYEGEIKNMGDTVHIRTKPTITIRDYQVNQDLLVERPSTNIVDLTIDYAKYFNEALDDIMESPVATSTCCRMWSDDAAEQMKIVIDTACADADRCRCRTPPTRAPRPARSRANINLGAAGAPIALTPLNVAGLIVDLGTCWTSRTSRRPGAGW